MSFRKAITGFSEYTGLDITNLIYNTVGSVADKSSYSLGESQHAPRTSRGNLQLSSQNRPQTSGNAENFTPSPSSSSPPTCFSTPLLSSSHPNTSTINNHRSPTGASYKMAPPHVADVDDTAAFMAAARSLKLEKEYGKPPVAAEGASSEQPGDDSHFPAFGSPDDGQGPAENQFTGFNEAFSFKAEPFDDGNAGETPVENGFNGLDETAGFDASNNGDVKKSLMELGTDEVAVAEVPLEAPTAELRSHTPELIKRSAQFEEDREHMTTFKSWGVPAARDKPAAQIRRCIIRGLPATWATPNKVLSLVHGGMIESISITATGCAHVLFCEPAACKAFFAKYPNGIDLDKERKLSVWVDLGNEVDVISSQLAHSLSVGSSRVVRAIGVEMDVAMTDIVKIATTSNRKVEKIIDSYVPGAPRTVIFRFCSIEDAGRFRSAIVRNDDWEHCNVHFTTDPCEVATGYHAD